MLEGVEEAVLWQRRDDRVFAHHSLDDVRLEHGAALAGPVLRVQGQVQRAEVHLPQALAARPTLEQGLLELFPLRNSIAGPSVRPTQT